MRETVKKYIDACLKLSALGDKLTIEDWEVEWKRFVELHDKHFAAGEGVLNLEPLRMLRPPAKEKTP